MKYVFSILIFCVVLFFYLHINHHLYKSNDLEEFVRKFHILDNEKTSKNLILNNLKTAKKFSLFDHYKNLNVILSIN